MAISEETFFLDPRTEGTLQSRIRQMVAEGVLSGRFRPGERMPSSRKLARHLGVSRLTVTLAYTELVADDYLTSSGRSGYFVSENAPPPPQVPPRRSQGGVDWAARLATAAPPAPAVDKPTDWMNYTYPFVYGQADPTLFDQQNWRLCALQALGRRDFTPLTTDYGADDDPQLVEFIARHTLPRRGILARAEEILITAGAQNALWLAAAVLLGRGRTAAHEDPCYPGLRDILARVGGTAHPVAVDADGLAPDAIPDGTDVVFVTPSHQCPTTATMPLKRRQALLAAARARDMLIVEDDYEFEMSFLGAPSPAMKSLDEDGRVIYAGSFSKSLFPGLRLGYLVGDAAFIAEARSLRSAVLRHIPGHIQRTAAYFLSRGHYDALVRRLRVAFQKRREVLDAAIAEHGLIVAGRPTFGGSSLWMRTPEGVTGQALAATLRDQGVLIEPGAPFFGGAGGDETYRLAYSSISERRIAEGVRRIAAAQAR